MIDFPNLDTFQSNVSSLNFGKYVVICHKLYSIVAVTAENKWKIIYGLSSSTNTSETVMLTVSVAF